MQHLNYCPDFLSSFSPGLEQLTREIVRKWNCHFIYFRNLFHFCLILQHHLEKTADMSKKLKTKKISADSSLFKPMCLGSAESGSLRRRTD